MAEDRLYVLMFKARRFWWLPWPKKSLEMSKITNWADAGYWANEISELARTSVQIYWWELENAPPDLLAKSQA